MIQLRYLDMCSTTCSRIATLGQFWLQGTSCDFFFPYLSDILNCSNLRLLHILKQFKRREINDDRTFIFPLCKICLKWQTSNILGPFGSNLCWLTENLQRLVFHRGVLLWLFYLKISLWTSFPFSPLVSVLFLEDSVSKIVLCITTAESCLTFDTLLSVYFSSCIKVNVLRYVIKIKMVAGYSVQDFIFMFILLRLCWALKSINIMWHRSF